MDKKIKVACVFLVVVLLIVSFVVGYMTAKNFKESNQPPSIEIKTVQEIHVETIGNDLVYARLIDYLTTHDNVTLMLLVKSNLSETVWLRYTMLKKLGYKIGLHVHIALLPEIDSVSYQQQYGLLVRMKYLLEWRLKITVKDFAPGWWSYNNDTLKAAYDAGLTVFHVYGIGSNKALPFEGEVVIVKKYFHDFELLYSPKMP